MQRRKGHHQTVRDFTQAERNHTRFFANLYMRFSADAPPVLSISKSLFSYGRRPAISRTTARQLAIFAVFACIYDRLHLKGSCAFSIEYKATGEKASPKQRAEAVRLKAAGIPCRCIDNVSDAREFINIMSTVAESSSDPFLDMAVLSNDIRSFDP